MEAAELYRQSCIKENCESSFRFFVEYVFYNVYGLQWVHNWHHSAIINALLALERRELPNLVINMPPRYGKTELAVILWIAWSIVRNPKAQFIHLSYSDELALKNSAQVRAILRHESIFRIWGIKTKDDADSKSLWLTEQNGGLKAGSTSKAVTGFGAGITSWANGDAFDGAIICDDPLKPLDARSETVRKSVNELFSDTLHSRRNHDLVPMVIVMQRLHVDDPSGYALSGGVMGDSFHHLKLPALLPDGTALWRYKHTPEKLQAMQSHNKNVFSGQYQQAPFIEKGEVYNLEKCPRYMRLPDLSEVKMIVISWDTAYKPAQHNDPSVATVWYVTGNLFYLAYVWRKRCEYPELRRKVKELADEYKPHAVLIEDKASGQSLIQEFNLGSTLPVHAMLPNTDKETRARTTATFFDSGRIVLPENEPWIGAYEQELIAFPNSSHDDQVDSTSQFLDYMRLEGDDEFDEMYERLYGKRQ